MNWTENEKAALDAVYSQWVGHVTAHELAMAVASRAASLLAERGGTMTAEQIASMFKALGGDDERAWSDTQRWCATEVGPLIQHARAQGAEVATLRENVAALEKDRASLRQSIAVRGVKDLHDTNSRLRAELAQEKTNSETWRQRCEKAAEALADVAPGELGRLDLVGRISALKAQLKPSGQVAEDVSKIREILSTLTHYDWTDGAEAALSRLAALAQQGQEAMKTLVAIRERAGNRPRLVAVYKATRDGLLGVNLEDVAQWVVDGDEPKAATVANAPWRCAAGTCGHDDAKDPGHAERVAARSQAFNEAAGLPPLEPLGLYGPKEEEAWNKGAEAMRAACIENVTLELEARGLDDLVGVFKAAIEGAAP